MNDTTAHIGQPKISALKSCGELQVIETEAVERCGMKIVHMNGILLDSPPDS